MSDFSMRLIEYWGKILQHRVLMAGTRPLGKIQIETYNKVVGMPTENYDTGWLYTDKVN